ncbi:MAG TPA: hypothetical protein EYH05_00330 [Anaerolineae bacterium]|nr:hypothetical protein [Anaerolineae bacterium]
MKLIDILLLGIDVVIVLLLVSCQPKTEPITITVPPVSVTEKARFEATSGTAPVTTTLATITMETATLFPTLVTLVTPTGAAATLTPILTQTALPTETMTPTPWPTLPPDEAAERVIFLLADNQNADCLLPCWWGATPGQTQWQDIKPFLKSFAIKITESPKGALVKIPLPKSIAMHGFSYIGYGWNKSQTIRVISVHSVNVSGYDPKAMMTLYGVPDEVWLTTLDTPREGVLPFQLIIVYQKQGISFHYYVDASTDGESVTACFEPGVVEIERPDLFPVGPRIRLWEPGQYKTIDEIANIPLEIYFPLEEKTDLTPQTLYEKFINPNERPCIDTPANSWKY